MVVEQNLNESQALQGSELFVALLTKEHSRLLGFILTLVPHRHDAEDLLQKVSLTLWSKFGEYDSTRDFFAWASKVAFFVVCNHRRALYRRRLTFSQELLDVMSRERVDHLEQQGTRLDLLVTCVEKLAADDQRLLFQMYAENFSIKDIAATTGKAVQTLYNRLGILRRNLMQCVQRKLSVEGV